MTRSAEGPNLNANMIHRFEIFRLRRDNATFRRELGAFQKKYKGYWETVAILDKNVQLLKKEMKRIQRVLNVS